MSGLAARAICTLAVSLVAVTGCGRGQQPAGSSHSEGLEVSLVGMLQDLHSRMVAEGLPLREVRVVNALVHDRDLTITLAAGPVVWAPTGAAATSVPPATVVLPNLPLADVEYWSSASLPLTALAVLTGDSVLAIAPTRGAGGEIVGAGDTTGPLFLGEAAEWIASMRYSPVLQPIDHCGQVAREEVAGTPRAALMDYLELLGDVPEAVRAAQEAVLRTKAESLAARAPAMRDPVTDEYVQVSVNHLYEQLVDGVDAERLTYEPTVPVVVDVAGLAPTAQDDPATQVAVFVDTRTRQVLGWIPVVGTWVSQDDAAPTPEFRLRAEIRRPVQKSDVGVLLRDIDSPRFDCPPDEEVVRYELSVPYDDFAGSRRSVVRLRSGTYHVADEH